MKSNCCEMCGQPLPGGDHGGMAELLGGEGAGEGEGHDDLETQLIHQLLDKLSGKSVERFKKPDSVSIEMIAAGKPKKDDDELGG